MAEGIIITGTDFWDTLEGTPDDDTIIGGLRADTMTGGAGSDVFVFGPGDASWNRILDFEIGSDRIDLTGLNADFSDLSFIHFTTGAVLQVAGEKVTVLYGVTGTDLTPADFIGLNNIPADPKELPRDLWLSGTRSDDLLEGGSGHDTLFGNSGNDTLIAGDGDDLLFGSGGFNTFFGGRGDDFMKAAGTDTFIFEADFGNDTIERFNNDGDSASQDFDILDVSALDLDKTFDELDSSIQTIDGRTGMLVDFGDGNSIFTQNATLSSLDFIGLKVADPTTPFDGHDTQMQTVDGRFEVAGDINADGFEDLVLANTSQVRFGSSGGGQPTVELAFDNGPMIPGAGPTQFMAPVGDLDGDGLSEFAIVQRLPEDDLPRTFEVGVGILSGADMLDPDTDAVPEFSFSAFATTRVLGVSAAGDVDGDGFGDVVLQIGNQFSYSANTTVIVGFGHAEGYDSMRTGAGSALVSGMHQLVMLGDYNGDGKDEFGVGSGRSFAYHRWPNNNDHGPRIFEHGFRDFDGFAAPLTDVGDVNRNGHVPQDGELYAVGDIDKDGRSDFVVLDTLFTEAGTVQTELGFTAKAGGDYNGDGFTDLAVHHGDKGFIVLGNDANSWPTGGFDALEASGRAIGFAMPFRFDPVFRFADLNGDALDELIVSASDETLIIEGASVVVTATGGVEDTDQPDLLIGTAEDDLFLGGLGVDSLIGFVGDDSMDGGQGNDDLRGKGGADTIDGGEGNDLVFGGNGGDSILGGDGGDTLNGYNDNDTIQGGSGTDVIDGDFGDDSLSGEGGGDSIFGGFGNDMLFGGSNNDRLIGGAGNDTLLGDADNDLLNGDDGSDRVLGGDGNDRVVGELGNDTLLGEDGDDTIRGGSDADQMFGGLGRDVVKGDEGNDRVFGGDGDDRVEGGTGNDTLDGESGSDTLRGDTGADLLDGGLGADIIVGGDGQDTLIGGGGADTMFGGAGADTLVLQSGDLDVVRGYQRGIDKLDVYALNTTFEELEFIVGPGVTIRHDGEDVVRLLGDALSANDFVGLL